MVFTLISETQEYLNQVVEEEERFREEEKLRKIKEAEKAELVSVACTLLDSFTSTFPDVGWHLILSIDLTLKCELLYFSKR